jgi:hypothetical protein
MHWRTASVSVALLIAVAVAARPSAAHGAARSTSDAEGVKPNDTTHARKRTAGERQSGDARAGERPAVEDAKPDAASNDNAAPKRESASVRKATKNAKVTTQDIAARKSSTSFKEAGVTSDKSGSSPKLARVKGEVKLVSDAPPTVVVAGDAATKLAENAAATRAATAPVEGHFVTPRKVYGYVEPAVIPRPTPKPAPSPATVAKVRSVRRGRAVQAELDALSRGLQAAQNAAQKTHQGFIAHTVDERNRFLRSVPNFWHDVLLALPSHDSFLSADVSTSHRFPLRANAFQVSGGTTEHPAEKAALAARIALEDANSRRSDVEPQRVVTDHHLLRNFLVDVRCHRVHGGQHSLETIVDIVNRVGDGTPPADQHHAGEEATAATHAAIDDSYRIEFEFLGNPYFSDRRLFKQVPTSLTTMFHNDIDGDDEHLGNRKGSRRLGIGNDIQWSSSDMKAATSRSVDSFFALFDGTVYANADHTTRFEMRGRLASLVSAVCTFAETAPIDMYEQRQLEREHRDERLRLLYAAHTNGDEQIKFTTVPDDEM